MRPRFILAATIATLLTTSIVGPDVSIAAPTTGFQFVGLSLSYDSRIAGSELASGVPRAVPAGVSNVYAFDAQVPSWLYFHPCDAVADRSQPAAVQVDPSMTEVNTVAIAASDSCMTLFGKAHVLITKFADEGAASGMSYVAHPEPASIAVTPMSTTINVRDHSVPADAGGVALWVTITAPSSRIAAFSVGVCNGGLGTGTVINAAPGTTSDNLMIAPIDASGQLCVQTFGNPPLEITINRFGYLAPDVTPSPNGLPYSGFIEDPLPGFVALPPQRLFDTRDGGAPPVGSGQVYRYQFSGLPADATAVALNVTATSTTAPGHVTAYPCDAATPPTASNVNYTGANQTIPNFAIVSLGVSKELCFSTLRTTHLLVDLAGYFLFGGGDGYVALTPDRLFDTRDTGARLGPLSTYERNLTGVVPADATAVVMNVTATATGGAGHVTVYPCGLPLPTVSNLNYLAGQTRPNLVTVKLPPDKRVCFFTLAPAHLLADLAGYYTPTSNVGFFDVEPYRVFDTRDDGQPVASGEVIGLDFTSSYLRALAWNLTATATQGAGHVTAFPCSEPLPKTSNVNYSGPGQTTANFAIIQPDAVDDVCFFALTGTHLLADEAGAFLDPIPVEVFLIDPFGARPTAGYSAGAAPADRAARSAHSAMRSITSSVWARPTNNAS